jgi:hypothetical protein
MIPKGTVVALPPRMVFFVPADPITAEEEAEVQAMLYERYPELTVVTSRTPTDISIPLPGYGS